MNLPLEGVRVIELFNFATRPFCGMLLADMGAGTRTRTFTSPLRFPDQAAQ